jgi:hypothetical protein
MHFDFFVEDQSGTIGLKNLIPKIIGDEWTYKLHQYKGIGNIPKDMKDPKDASKRQLLNSLPKILQGVANTYKNSIYSYYLIFICDLDSRCLKEFRQELLQIAENCHPKPNVQFCIAVEEFEAWLLGEQQAIIKAFPNAKKLPLDMYKQDSICGTWQVLADSLYKGGSKKLISLPYSAIGKEKCDWAKTISPLMNVEENRSQSFCYFRDKLRLLLK